MRSLTAVKGGMKRTDWLSWVFYGRGSGGKEIYGPVSPDQEEGKVQGKFYVLSLVRTGRVSAV